MNAHVLGTVVGILALCAFVAYLAWFIAGAVASLSGAM